MENMVYAHYFPLTSQGNIYSMTKLAVLNSFKLLIASLKREIICFEYVENATLLTPSSKEVLFTYIPNGAEIIAVDAFNKSNKGNDIVIGITIIKTDVPKESYFNIYTGEDNADFNIDNISQNCLMIDLNYTPYQLYHTIIPLFEEESNKSEIVWLLSGSDSKIHLYRDTDGNHSYKETDITKSFVELANVPSIVLWMDVMYYGSKKRRITVFGCESGYVQVSTVDTKNNCVLNTWNIQFVNMIACVKLFTLNSNSINIQNIETEMPQINLVVTNTILPSVVFMDLLKNGLSKKKLLLKSNFYNTQSTCCIADIDYDGENEILIGTYGQEILAYKYKKENDWSLSEHRSFGNPIYSIQFLDITSDGMRELIVLTLKGVHIIQNKPEDIEKKLLSRLKRISLNA
ncbi:KICSTOR complex protein kaptin-like [Chrysoperla carnea]|uniref:KICSTOR complex protein kaptin-like n=1 Tax=Chrysoperla carnea TaxID=189513 RepID=UPI001D064FBF|nr:KICSTOR complex protein kaptin-like [Chrysoperla carnea]